MKKRSFDPLYGVIEYSDLEWALITSPEIQRLRYVRMCNINSLLISGASEISRFEHTLGVLHLTKIWANAHQISQNDSELICSAAILHDFFTGGFGHSLQYILEDNEVEGDFSHEDVQAGSGSYYVDIDAKRTYLGCPFSSQKILGSRWEEVARIIEGKGQFGPIISGTIDLDNIDNVIRLAYHAGFAKSTDVEIATRLAANLNTKDGELVVPKSEISTIEKWQAIRKKLYQYLLHDWAEFSAKAMLTKALESASSFGLIGADSWIQTDLQLLYELTDRARGKSQHIAIIIKRLLVGDLYSPICLLRAGGVRLYKHLNTIHEKADIENKLREFARFKKMAAGSFLVHAILDYNKTERPVEVMIPGEQKRVTLGDGTEEVLLGLFFSNDNLKESDRELLELRFSELLLQYGFGNIRPLPDPFGEEKESSLQEEDQMVFA